MARSLSLTPRAESTRDKQQVEQIIEHDLATIKGHFDESLAMIKNEFEIADTLLAAGKTEDAKNIWRSQVVFIQFIRCW